MGLPSRCGPAIKMWACSCLKIWESSPKIVTHVAIDITTADQVMGESGVGVAGRGRERERKEGSCNAFCDFIFWFMSAIFYS